jgi:hypothetical protein
MTESPERLANLVPDVQMTPDRAAPAGSGNGSKFVRKHRQGNVPATIPMVPRTAARSISRSANATEGPILRRREDNDVDLGRRIPKRVLL